MYLKYTSKASTENILNHLFNLIVLEDNLEVLLVFINKVNNLKPGVLVFQQRFQNIIQTYNNNPSIIKRKVIILLKNLVEAQKEPIVQFFYSICFQTFSLNLNTNHIDNISYIHNIDNLFKLLPFFTE